jgi:dynein heavy chain
MKKNRLALSSICYYLATAGAYIHGLFLEGAAWDASAPGGGQLTEQRPQELLSPMPVIWLRPVPSASLAATSASSTGAAATYSCPVYKTAARRGVLSTTGHSTNLVMDIRLRMPAGHDANHYIKRGTALLCQTSD